MMGVVVRFVLIFYSLTGLVAAALIHWRVGDDAIFDPYGLGRNGWPIFLFIALALVLAVHALSLAAYRRWFSLRRGVKEMRRWLGDLNRRDVLVLAVASGVAEELLFRGWLLNEIGLLGSSVIFGLVHVPPNKDWLYWPVFAFGMGLVLGALCLWSDSLIYAMLAHAGINYLNIIRLPRDSEGTGPFSAGQSGTD